MAEIIGITGAVLVLGAFIGNQLGWWSHTNWRYDLVNVIGSGLLVVYALITASYIFLVINAVWVIFSLPGIFKRQI